MRALADRIEAGEIGEARQEETDAVFTDAEAQDTHRRPSAATAQVARPVRHLARFKDDLAKRV